jgi:FAD/FMN-containing dehydrogenase
MIQASHIDALRALLGSKNVLAEAADLAPYESGARYDHGRAALVLRPNTTEDVSAVVAYCVRNGMSLVPQSGNTGRPIFQVLRSYLA